MKGGTASCVRYAKQKNKPILRYDPATDQVSGIMDIPNFSEREESHE